MKARLDSIDQVVDSRIQYPSYRSFDALVDLERLKGLDRYVETRIRDHERRNMISFFQNAHRLDPSTPYEPGVREIWLSQTKAGVPYDYLDLDKPELWEFADAANEFSELMGFIATLPFKTTGRMLIIYDTSGNAVPAHRDHLDPELCHHFIWFRTSLRKPFYVQGGMGMNKGFVESYTAWFDTVNQFHGADACPGLSFSFRVDGVFTDELDRMIPVPDFNLASRPALWASIDRIAEGQQTKSSTHAIDERAS